MVDLITVDKENRVFHLHNEQLSYIFSIEDGDTIFLWQSIFGKGSI